MTPYIDPNEVTHALPATRGQLANALAGKIAGYVQLSDLSYKTISDVRGAVLGALNEFERRVAEPYEQSKIEGGGHDPYASLEPVAHDRLTQARAARTAEALHRA